MVEPSLCQPYGLRDVVHRRGIIAFVANDLGSRTVYVRQAIWLARGKRAEGVFGCPHGHYDRVTTAVRNSDRLFLLSAFLVLPSLIRASSLRQPAFGYQSSKILPQFCGVKLAHAKPASSTVSLDALQNGLLDAACQRLWPGHSGFPVEFRQLREYIWLLLVFCLRGRDVCNLFQERKEQTWQFD